MESNNEPTMATELTRNCHKIVAHKMCQVGRRPGLADAATFVRNTVYLNVPFTLLQRNVRYKSW